jgi:hypothetical protein
MDAARQTGMSRESGAAHARQARQASRTPHFVFAGDDGACLGGMQDYYGAYGSTAAAMRAAPPGAHWAEVAALLGNRLVVVASGRRSGGRWKWQRQETGALRPRLLAA